VALAPGAVILGAAALVAGLAALGLVLALRPLVVPLALAAALFGVARAQLPAADSATAARAAALAGQQAVVEGRIADDVRTLGGGYEALVEPSRVQLASGPAPPIGNLMVRVRGPGQAAYGDLVHTAGRLALPADRPGFDRRAYLAQRQVFLELRADSLQVRDHPGGLPGVPGWLRDRYREAVQALLPAPHAAVLMGVVLGIRSGIPPDLEQDLIATGLVHLLVLSGLKVAVFARLLAGLLTPLLGRAATWPVLVLVGVYALAGGATPAALRAAAMGGITLLAARLGRPAHVWTSLAVTAAAMLAWRPELALDVGFQLSFAGTAAIVLLTPTLEHRLGRLPRPVREPFAVTCAAQVGTLPFMAASFHLVSPVAPIANAAVLPLLPALVAAGLLVAPLALLPQLPEAGRLAALPVAGLLVYLEQVARLLARVPAAAVPVPAFPPWAGLAYYAGLGGFAGALHSQGRRRLALLLAAVLAPLLVAGGELAAWGFSRPELSVLAVGDGQAVLVSGPQGTLLIDGGPSPARLNDQLGQLLPPWTRRLDAVLITAPSPGHVGGLNGLRYGTGLVGVPAPALPGSAWRSASLILEAGGATPRRLAAGDRLRVAGLEVEILSPEPGSDPEPGAGYLALRVRGAGGRSFCDLSDLDLAAQAAVAARLSGTCDYLLLPQGGRSAPAPELLRRALPQKLLASIGSGRLARELPATTLRTDQEGTITLPL